MRQCHRETLSCRSGGVDFVSVGFAKTPMEIFDFEVDAIRGIIDN